MTNPDKLFLFLNVKETISMLDLKKEVVLTMLNSLEKVEEHKKFMTGIHELIERLSK